MDAPNESVPLPASVRGFLAAPRHATIATVNPDGSPHQAVVWYALDGDGVMINSRNGRRWPANLERDPRISLVVYDDANPERWIGIRGQAEVVRSGAVAVADIQDLARRYPGGNPDEFIGQDRITFHIRVRSCYEYLED